MLVRRLMLLTASCCVLCFLLVLSPCLLRAAGAGEETIRGLKYEDVRVGQRLRVIRTRGKPFLGTVVAVTADSVRLDLSGELDGLNAWVDFPAGTIKKLELLRPLSASEKEAVARARKTEAEQALARAGKKSPATPTDQDTKVPDSDTSGPKSERPVLSEQQFALLRAFPPKDWGPERLTRVRQRWILRDLGPTPAESDFIGLYSRWEEAARQLEAVRRWETANRDVILLETFPPARGWSPERHADITAKQDAGAELDKLEAEFLRVYPEWMKAYKTHKKVEEPAQKRPEPSEPAKPEKPTTSKSTEGATDEKSDKPVPSDPGAAQAGKK